MAAFQAAAAREFGIEFDVRPSSDGVPIVFHDTTLDRMTDKTGRVEERRATELVGLALKGGGEIIRLDDMLSAWPAQTPLLCEMKIDGETDPVAFCAAVAALIDAHNGPAAMMSFSTLAVASIPETVMRGQLIAPSEGDASKNLAATPKVTVDYLACHTGDAGNTALQETRETMPLITWTVKTEEACKTLAPLTDSQIFEGFDPALAKRHILNT